MIGPEDRFDSIIAKALKEHFSDLLLHVGPESFLWIKAQIWQESRMDPLAVSPVGAQGLMQIMPRTAAGLGLIDPFDPEQNISAGIRYLADQWQHLGEVPDPIERLRFSLASYNAGRGYINMAFVLAREAEGLAGSYIGWCDDGRQPGRFQHWGYSRAFLSDSRCIVRGRRPDSKQVIDYVSRIEEKYFAYRVECRV